MSGKLVNAIQGSFEQVKKQDASKAKTNKKTKFTQSKCVF